MGIIIFLSFFGFSLLLRRSGQRPDLSLSNSQRDTHMVPDAFVAMKKGMHVDEINLDSALNLYDSPLLISQKKLGDIFKLEEFIPPVCKQWYDRIHEVGMDINEKDTDMDSE